MKTGWRFIVLEDAVLTMRSLPRVALPVILLPACLVAQSRRDYHRIAVATRRIDRGRLDIRIFQGKSPVKVGHFRELAVVTPINHSHGLGYLAEETVVLVRSDKHAGEWNVYTEAAPKAAAMMPAVFIPAPQVGDPLCLPDNIFSVKRVIVSTREAQVSIKFDGELCRLKAGEALLVLG